MMKAQARIAAASAGQSDFCTSHTASGKVAAPAIEPIEICRVHATTPTNTMTSAAIAHGVRHRNAPTKLATALPPRNRRNTGYACPAITVIAAALIRSVQPQTRSEEQTSELQSRFGTSY